MSSNPIEAIPDYTAIVGLKKTNLDALVSEYHELRAREKEIQARKGDLSALMTKLLIKAEVKTVAVEGLRVTCVSGGFSSKLDRKKLFQIGGDKVMKMLEKATVKTPRTPYVLVSDPSERRDEDGGGE